MAFDTKLDDASGGGDEGVMGEINMTPLVDVMLVLLIIFIVTVPVMQHAVRLDLPRASSARDATPPERVEIAIDGEGQLFWKGEAVSSDELQHRLTAASTQSPQPELHLRADRKTAYEHVAQVTSAAARAGLGKIAFVTEPAR